MGEHHDGAARRSAPIALFAIGAALLVLPRISDATLFDGLLGVWLLVVLFGLLAYEHQHPHPPTVRRTAGPAPPARRSPRT